ncbi:glycosyltransferase family 4 protein [Quadrisphaera sp. KR29]|uniref:glycosyltransferase family 4 protein n=1 Tax=Quadrisphaera sp. KR29 TaxID=3461391 RepID=UPI004043E86F
MRVAIVTDSFLPAVNGVVRSVLRVLEHLEREGHSALVVCASPGAPSTVHGAMVVEVPSLGLPGYTEVRVPLPSATRLRAVLAAFAPDVVHLASPFGLGGTAARAANGLGLPVVAVFQTDVAGFASRYPLTARVGSAQEAAWWRVEAIHRRAELTLAPTASVAAQLRSRGIPRTRVWARGVDDAFDPARRDPSLRAALAPHGEVLVGYVGRLAPEKRLEDLAVLTGVPGTRLVLVGDGPSRARLQALLPDAAFLGPLSGDRLAAAVASLDVFVHTGEHETFCQAAQEALASGVPVVAPAAGGLKDLVDPSRTGWLYAPGDLAGLRAHVTDLAGDAAKRRALGEAARERTRGRTWGVLCEQLLAHYRDALAVTV